jgi:alpha-L-rhamnosidase
MPIPRPLRLRCEYLQNPLGIDIRKPRFSWIFRPFERGQKPIAHEIIVSSALELARRSVGDCWDSGREDTDAHFHIEYGGKKLESRKRYYWRVRWWDKDGRRSAYSQTAFFEMGLLDKSDWQARWISLKKPAKFRTRGTVLQGKYRGDYIQTRAIYLKKDFRAERGLKRARVYICGLGFYELSLNGQKAGDRVLDPAQTDYAKTALYSTYDITKMLGEKNEALISLGNGRHIANFGYGSPRAIAQLEMEYENGERQVVGTDETWKSGHGPLKENGLYFGERCDGRHEPKVFKGHTVCVQGAPLHAQMLPPIKVVRRWKPKKTWCPGAERLIFDFGQNFSGWVGITVRGRAGTTLTLRHSELIREDGRLNTAPNQNAEATDVYILKGERAERYEPRFTQHGFRYAEVSGHPRLPRILDVEGCFVHSDVEPGGSFRCAHPLINRIHRNIRWGQLSNLMSIPTDCPQRDERHGWLGDAHLSAEEAILNFDMAAFYTKYLQDIKNAQKKTGSLPDTVPPYLGRLYPADPAWGSAYITLAWYLHLYYGDTRVLEEHFEAMKKYVFFLRRSSKVCIVDNLGKYGDWCPPGSIPPKKTTVALTSTWFFYHDALLLAKMAGVLDKRDDEKRLSRLARDIKTAFNKRFLGPDGYEAVRMSPVERIASQTSNVLPLYLDMVPKKKKSKVLDALLRSVVSDQDCHLDTGILGTRYLLDVLTENGHAETAFRVTSQESYPGWGYMVKEGATTLWERWEKITGGGMNSHNHIMLGSVDAWFYKTVAGVKCLAPGWKKILAKPPLFRNLNSASATLKTIRGDLRISWRRKEDRFELDLRIPVGAQAEIHIPLLWRSGVLKESERIIWRKGRRVKNLEGVSFQGIEDRRIILNSQSGAFRFRMEKNSTEK